MNFNNKLMQRTGMENVFLVAYLFVSNMSYINYSIIKFILYFHILYIIRYQYKSEYDTTI